MLSAAAALLLALAARPCAARGFDLDAAFAVADAASENGEDAAAFKEADAALAQTEKLFGPNDPRTLGAVGRHGRFARLAGKTAALDADLRRLESVSPPTPVSLLEEARLLRGSGRGEEALRAARRAVALRPEDAEALREQGEDLLLLGKTDEGLVSLSSAAARAPQSYALQKRLAEALRVNGRYQESLEAYRRAKRAAPGKQIDIAEGYARLRAGDPQGALDEFAALASSAPGDPVLLHHWGELLFRVGRSTEAAGRFEEARRLLEARGQRDEHYVHTLNHLASVYRALGRAEQARQTARTALAVLLERPRLEPRDVFWAASAGEQVLALHGGAGDVLELESRALAFCPGPACPADIEGAVRVALAEAAARTGRPQQAREQAARALALLRTDHPVESSERADQERRVAQARDVLDTAAREAWSAADRLSEAADDAGALREADASLSADEARFGESDDRALQALGRHGRFASLAGRRDVVAADIRRLEAVSPATTVSLTELSRLRLESGRAQESLEAARRAVALAPQDSRALSAKGEALLALGETDEGLASISSAAARSPQSYWLQQRLAEAYRAAGRFQEALEAQERARRAAPGRRVDIDVGYARLRAGDPQGALHEFAALAASSPTDPVPLHHWGQVLFELDRPAEAAAKFEEARRLFESQGRADDDYLHTLERMGDVYHALGRKDAALDAGRSGLSILEKRPRLGRRDVFWVCELGRELLRLHDSAARVRLLAERALGLCPRTCRPLDEASLRLLEARAAAQLGEAAPARRQAESALALLEGLIPDDADDCAKRAERLGLAGQLLELENRPDAAERAYALAKASASCLTSPGAARRVRALADDFACRKNPRAGVECASLRASIP